MMGKQSSRVHCWELTEFPAVLKSIFSAFFSFDHISQGWRSLTWLGVLEKVSFNDLVLAFKCVNGLAPDYLGKYFVKRSPVHNKNTQGCNNFVVPQCRLSMGQRAFYFQGPREWDGLADNIKNRKEINRFKWTLFKNMFHTKKKIWNYSWRESQ